MTDPLADPFTATLVVALGYALLNLLIVSPLYLRDRLRPLLSPARPVSPEVARQRAFDRETEAEAEAEGGLPVFPGETR